jgi:archaellum component FlaC
MAENVDQAVIDEILATAEADTPESRIDQLEKEVNMLKGSIKRLLMDLRETMNNLENPFQNLQNLAEGMVATQAPQQIQVIPTPVPQEPAKEEKEGEKEEEVIEDLGEEKESKEDDGVIDEIRELREDLKRGVGRVEEVVDKGDDSMLELAEKRVERVAGERDEVKVKTELTKYDIVTLFNLMEWVKGMLEKYDSETLKGMLEIFEIAGYISSESKEFMSKLVDLLSANNGFEDMLLELYRLHKIVYPEDTSMDSKLLSLLLERRL